MSDEATIGAVSALGKHWVALTMDDGRVVIQCRSHVGLPDGYIVDLNHPNGNRKAQEHAEEVVVRSMVLMPDGSILSDPHALSVEGIPSDSATTIFSSFLVSFSQYFKSHKS